MVEIRYRGYLNELTGKKGELIDALRVKDVINYINKVYGKNVMKCAKAMLITVDGVCIQLLNRFKTPLKDGTIVSFHPISGGG